MSAKTILVKGKAYYDEAFAAGAITPGHLIKKDSTGKVVVHATAGGPGEVMFAREDALQGKTVSGAYASGDPVGYLVPEKGAIINAILDAGENVIIGDFLQSAGNGNVEKRTGSNTIFAVAEEALNLSATGAVATRILARII